MITKKFQKRKSIRKVFRLKYLSNAFHTDNIIRVSVKELKI